MGDLGDYCILMVNFIGEKSALGEKRCLIGKITHYNSFRTSVLTLQLEIS